MAIEKGNANAMTRLISYYKRREYLVEVIKLVQSFGRQLYGTNHVLTKQVTIFEKACTDDIKIFNMLKKYIEIDDIVFIIREYYFSL